MEFTKMSPQEVKDLAKPVPEYEEVRPECLYFLDIITETNTGNQIIQNSRVGLVRPSSCTCWATDNDFYGFANGYARFGGG